MAIFLRQRRWIGWEVLALALALAWITGSPAQAGILVGDAHAMAGWDGSVPLSTTYSSPPSLYSLNAVVDYAVYKPGYFNLSFPGDDPSAGARYVYAYQFFNNVNSTEYIKLFSVGLDGDEQVANQAQLTDPDAPAGEPATFAKFGSAPTSAAWAYSGLHGSKNVLPGQKSEILIFTSPFGPQWASTELTASDAVSAENPNGVPSPTPEPSAAILLATAVGLFGLLGFVRRRFRD